MITYTRLHNPSYDECVFADQTLFLKPTKQITGLIASINTILINSI